MRVLGLLVLIVAGACTRRLPAWSPVGPQSTLEVLGTRGAVTVARVRLPAAQTFRFEAGAYREVVVFVEQGMVRASSSWIEKGRVASFRTPAVVQAMSENGATLCALIMDHAPSASGEAIPPSMLTTAVADLEDFCANFDDSTLKHVDARGRGTR